VPTFKKAASSIRRRESGQDSTDDRLLGIHDTTSDSAITKFIQQCLRGETTCDEKPEQRSLLPERTFDEFDCCRGVVSGLQLIYHGAKNGTLYLPHDSMPDLSDVVNPCGQGANNDEDAQSVYFADCSRCFPKQGDKSLGNCDFYEDTNSSIRVKPGDTFCVVSFDLDVLQASLKIRFPKYLPLLFQQDGNDSVYRFELRTSCNTPLSPPYGVRLGSCSEGGSSFVNLLEGPDIDSSYIEFVDGVTAEEPTVLFTDCSIQAGVSHCCRGGASFVKLSFDDSDSGGLMTLNSTIAAEFSPCILEHVIACEGNVTDSLETLVARFLHCDDPCLDPFSTVQCLCSYDALLVDPGSEICIAMYDMEAGRVFFDTQLPSNLPLYFVPYSNESDSFKTLIRTSCSDPLNPSFAQAFFGACNETDAPLPLNLDTTEDAELPPIRITFLDGISSNYYDAAISLGLNESNQFDISFAGCGCACEARSAVPSSSIEASFDLPMEPSFSASVPTSFRTFPTISATAELPSVVPTEAPLSSASKPTKKSKKNCKKSSIPKKGIECKKMCEDWIYENCVFVDDGSLTSDPCVIEDTDENGTRLLQQLDDLKALEFSLDSVDKRIDYHSKIIDIYMQVLENI